MISLPSDSILASITRKLCLPSVPPPAALADAVRAHGELPDTGPLSVGVPGAPAGSAALAESAALPLADLAAPAIQLARRTVLHDLGLE